VKVRRPWFRFWPGDWLAARRVALMTPAQKGVYIDLLCLSWQEGYIPADPIELAFLLRLPLAEFEPIWNVVKTHFKSVKNAPKKLVNLRLEDERYQAQEKSDKTKKAAHSRWDKLNASAHADAEHSQCSTEAYSEAEAELSITPQESVRRFDLDEVYARYPNKKGKVKGLAKLKALVKTEADYQAVMAGLSSFIADEKRKGTEDRYIPHFSTWVNQRRWEDYSGTTEEPKQQTLGLAERARLREAQERGLT
jgi:uncharacterized protein YdaU (DUF1376 family)